MARLAAEFDHSEAGNGPPRTMTDPRIRPQLQDTPDHVGGSATPPVEEVTAWLRRWGYGDSDAVNAVFPEVYRELRRVGHRLLARERDDHTLSTTALVHESYLRLLGQHRVAARDREEFLAIAAVTMRRVLVDHARNRNRQKRGGDAVKVGLDDVAGWLSAAQADEAEALDAALDALAEQNERAALIVHLRFFVGLSCEEVAELLRMSDRTVRRDWTVARAWLRRKIRSQVAAGSR